MDKDDKFDFEVYKLFLTIFIAMLISIGTGLVNLIEKENFNFFFWFGCLLFYMFAFYAILLSSKIVKMLKENKKGDIQND